MLTDGGIETTLIFHEGLELPDFAAFHLLGSSKGTAALDRYFRAYADIASRFETGLILESATWRANPDWAARLGYNAESLAAVNRKAIEMLEAEGSAVAFPEVFKQVREDMKIVANRLENADVGTVTVAIENARLFEAANQRAQRLSILNEIVVINFSNLRVFFGWGIWWLTLALIGIMVRPTIGDKSTDSLLD